ncbi:hypothetical protein RCL1_002865 [Eukaryota sp. TZLM3-RCL]
MSSSAYRHEILKKLLDQRRKTVLTDFDIIYCEQVFPCHKAVAVAASKTIASCVASNDFSLIVPASIETTPEAVQSVIDSFYGVPLNVTNKNALEIYEFSRFIGMSPLFDVCKDSLKEYQPKKFNTTIESVLFDLENDQFRDFFLVYKNVRIKLHKFLLATLCPVFLSRFELQPGDNEWNFTDLLTIQESSFEQFFTSFYKDNITIDLENLFDISHLAFYFQMSSLESCCDSLMNSAEPLVSWIFPSLESADKADDLRFVDRLASVLVKVDDLAQSEPVAIKPDVLYKLCPNVNVFWLSTVLVHSYFHYDYNNQRVWTPNEVQKALTQIDTNTLTINQLYSTFKPLLKVEELFSVLSEFSLTRFTIEKSEVPSEWLVWLMVELDKNEPTNELNLTTRFASLLSKVFSKAKLSLIEPLVLHPKSFNVYLSNITQQYLILWFLLSLIISWKVENHWTIEIFDEILSIVNLENVDSRELIAVLRPLENIAELFDFFCKFMSTKVTPLVIRDYAKTSEELSTSKQENESLKKSKEEVEKNLQSEISKLKSNFSELQNAENQLKSQFNSEKTRREELEKKDINNQKTINNLQSEISKLKLIVDKHAEIIRRAEEEEQRRIEEERGRIEEEQRRIEEEQRRIEEERGGIEEERRRIEEEQRRFEEEKRLEEERQRLLPSYRSNPLSFIANNPNNFFNVCGGKVKFLSETSGSRLTLSNDDLRVDKNGSYGYPNSFIAINRPPTGKVVLTGNNVFDSFIGVFNPSQAQGGYPYDHMSGIRVGSNCFYVYLRGSRSNQTNTKITRVEVEFTQSNFQITLPQANWSRDYDYEEGWVFGLVMRNSGESWLLE